MLGAIFNHNSLFLGSEKYLVKVMSNLDQGLILSILWLVSNCDEISLPLKVFSHPFLDFLFFDRVLEVRYPFFETKPFILYLFYFFFLVLEYMNHIIILLFAS